MKNISMIVAVAENLAIGKDNQLLWHISNDLKRFKRITQGHTVIMGKKTYESLPVSPLPNRTNVVLTDVPGEKIAGCSMAYSIEEALALCKNDNECFVMGGGSVYKQFMPYANKLYITKVNRKFEADTFFPLIDENEWKLLEQEDVMNDAQNDFTYSFLTYGRTGA